MASLYYNGAVDTAWENPLNWWLDDAATIPALNAPWVNGVDTAYLGYDLTYATGASNSPRIGVAIGTGATGTCDIWGVFNVGTISGGTFTGLVINGGTINNGTFGVVQNGDGYSYEFQGTINNGTFTGNGCSNGGYSNINGGTFTGSGFYNYSSSYISGGTFTGSGFTNSGSINGGTFTGSGFYNYSITFSNIAGLINGGTFTGSGFISVTNPSIGEGGIFGGTFIEPSSTVSSSGGYTYLSLNASPACPTLAYPTPAPSGGGSDQMVARLLNLPWFINL
jgi:hypothetical protein